MSTPWLRVLLGNNLPWTLCVTRRWKSTNLVYAISQPGAFLILSKAKIQYGLTLSKALERSASKTQADLSPSRILWMHETAFCGSLKIRHHSLRGMHEVRSMAHNIRSNATIYQPVNGVRHPKRTKVISHRTSFSFRDPHLPALAGVQYHR